MKRTLASILVGLACLPSIAQKNVVKLNLSSLAFQNVYMTYERALARKFSVSLGFSFLPDRGIPFGSYAPDVKERESPIKNMNLKGFNITPEFRLYTSAIHESPHGFYLAPYLRYSQYSFGLSDYKYDYKDEFDNNIEKTAYIDFDSKITSFGGGLMIGHQWIIGKHVSIDFWIVGIGLNSTKFTLRGTDTEKSMNKNYFTSTSTFSKDTQDYFAALGTVDVTSSQSDHYVETSISTIYPAIRGLGLNLGFAF